MNATPAVQNHRAAINGMDMYYEVRGSGEPLLMSHGAVLPDVGPSAEALAQDRMIIAPHLQGRAAQSSRRPDRPRCRSTIQTGQQGLGS